MTAYYIFQNKKKCNQKLFDGFGVPFFFLFFVDMLVWKEGTLLVGVVVGGALVDLVEEASVFGKTPPGLIQEVGKVQPAAFFLLEVVLE